MNEPVPIRPRTKINKGALVIFGVLTTLALIGIIEAVVLITLAVTGQIG